MERGSFFESGRPMRAARRDTRIVIRTAEQRRLRDSAPSTRNLLANIRAMERGRLLDGALTKGQRTSLSSLLGEVSEFRSSDAHSVRYLAWWGQLTGLVRRVQSTPARSLSDAEWDALLTEVFIAWEETGILKSHVRASARDLRKRLGQRPGPRRRATRATLDEPRSSPRRVEGPGRRSFWLSA